MIDSPSSGGELDARGRRFRRLAVAIPLTLLLCSLGAYAATRERLPAVVRIAAGRPGGQFHEAAAALAPRLSARLGLPVELVSTEGSEENADAVRRGRAELALVQANRATMRGVATVAPLYPDVYVVLARRDRGVARLSDLAGRPVAIGRRGSGVHDASRPLLARHGVSGPRLVARERAFDAIATDPTLDASIVITGLLHPELARLLADPSLTVLPIEDAEGLALRDPFLVATTIPPGTFSAHPLAPSEPVSTLATTAVLVSRPTLASSVVEAVLACLYEEDFAVELPTLVAADEARASRLGIEHEATRAYHDPYAGIDTLGNVVQSLDAGKELLVALFAGIYLVAQRLRRTREKVKVHEAAAAANQLDVYLEHTLRIERELSGVADRERLLALAEQLRSAKLEALTRLTHESLRGDQRFLIFLTQCAAVGQQIEEHIARLDREAGLPSRAGEGTPSRPEGAAGPA